MKRRILLADDSVTIQKVIELTFMDEDYEVRAVSNGDDAVKLLPDLEPEFVIADVHMPGANGYEVCRRSKELRPDVPVLLLVGTFEPFDEAQARAAGADSHLKKPFDSQELLQRVEELLAGKPAAAPAAPAAGPTPTGVADWAAQAPPAPLPLS
ncbi:MAG TPA: response regulator, partial [Thermoanaerobaculia bacterium]